MLLSLRFSSVPLLKKKIYKLNVFSQADEQMEFIFKCKKGLRKNRNRIGF